MSRIQTLDRAVAERIAAGEAVERPASVVKELVENSVDAGAKRIQVEIRRGGLALVRVSDDGEGIAPDELPLAFLRHATSKIRTADDLEHISSLGFRGEALASIAAVSRVRVQSRVRGAVEGASYAIDGGEGGEVEPVGCPEGTSISVAELFYNTPARQKFLKRDSAEAARVAAVVLSQGLAHPEVSIRLLRDGESELFSSGGSLGRAVYDLMGATFAAGLLPAKNEQGGIRVCGFVSKPAYGHGNRRKQEFFVNRRPVVSRMLAAAVETAYKSRMVQGRFPACVLHVELPPELVDVNVHPAKTEVKFAYEREVYDAVYLAVASALEQGDARAEIGRSAPRFEPDLPAGQEQILVDKNHAVAGEVGEFYRRMQREIERDIESGLAADEAEEYYKKTGGKIEFHEPERKGVAPNGGEIIEIGFTHPTAAQPRPSDGRGSAAPQDGGQTRNFERQSAAPQNIEPQNIERLQGIEQPSGGQPPVGKKPAIPQYRILGEVFSTYIVVEDGDELVFIDKHAAHERIIFDRLLAQEQRPMEQMLLEPKVVQLGREESAAIRAHIEELSRLGFEISDFGGGSLLLRALPNELEPDDAESTLEQIAEQYLEHKKPTMTERREEILRLVACKAAIKAGMRTSPAEREVLVERVMEYRDIRFCPHGRPVAAVLSRAELERRISRRV